METEVKTMLAEVKDALGEHNKVKAALAQLEEQVRGLPAAMDQKIKAVRAAVYDPRSGRYRGTFRNEDHARGFGLYVLGQVAQKRWAAEALKSEFPDVSKAFTSANAGELIPEEYTGDIIDLIEQYGVFERNAQRVPMSTDKQRYSKKTARMTAVAMDEGTAVSETKPTLAAKALTAGKWGTYIEIPSEVSDDAVIAIAEMVASDMAEAHALAVDTAGFNGDGTSTYNSISGVLDALIAEAVVDGSGDTWGELVLDDFLKVVSLPVTKTFVGNNAKWYCSHQFYWTVMAPIALSAGGVTAAEIEGRRRLMFLGFEVELTQVLPTATAVDTPCAVFGNLRLGAAFGDRRQLTVKQSMDYKFAEDMIAMLGTRRYDIQVHGAGTGTTVDVLAALATAAS